MIKLPNRIHLANLPTKIEVFTDDEFIYLSWFKSDDKSKVLITLKLDKGFNLIEEQENKNIKERIAPAPFNEKNLAKYDKIIVLGGKNYTDVINKINASSGVNVFFDEGKQKFSIAAKNTGNINTGTDPDNEPEIILEPTKTVKGLVLKLDVPTKQFVLKLADENLNTIYSENVLEGTYAKEFNMKELQSGTYYFSIEAPIFPKYSFFRHIQIHHLS